MHVELQLHQQFVIECMHKISRVGSAANMADLDARTRSIGQLDVARLLVKTRQLIFDRGQRLEHLPYEKGFGPLLRLGDRQHAHLQP
jgi:hypothetical protein